MKSVGKVTLTQVATAAGVSRGAACAALRGGRSSTTVVSVDVAEHVREVARALGYVPNAAARALRCNRVSQMGVILPNRTDGSMLASPQSFETLMGINAALQEGGHVVVLARLHDVLKSDVEAAESVLFRERMIDVAIAVGQFEEEDMVWISKRVGKVIWCDGKRWDGTCCVRRDESDAGRLAVRKMAEAGVKRVLVVADAFVPGQHFSFRLRYEGVVSECARQGLECRHVTWPEAKAMSREELVSYGVVTIAFDMAEHAYIEWTQRGVVPGRDISLVSCDDYHQQWWIFQDIARVDFDRGEMGARAAQMALAYASSGEEPASELVTSRWRETWGGNTLMGMDGNGNG